MALGDSSKTLDMQDVLDALKAFKNGDLSVRLPENLTGTEAEVARTFNALVDQLDTFASETLRITRREVGYEGKFGGQMAMSDLAGTWKEIADGVNFMGGNLTSQIRDITRVTHALANGDLTRKVSVDAQGEMLELKVMINNMVDGLNRFAAETTRIFREIGTEGRFGGQAEIGGIKGTWKDLVDNINLMAARLTDQLRDMSNVSRAAIQGDLSRQVTCEAKGETLELMSAINRMVNALSAQSPGTPRN